MLETNPIKVMPVKWGRPLTNWFNKDLVKPVKRIPVQYIEHETSIPVHYYWKTSKNWDIKIRVGQLEYKIRKQLAEAKR